MPQAVTSLTQWKIHVYRVRTSRRQQRILSAFERIARPGVIATGAESGSDCFIVVEYSTRSAEIHALRVIRTIDPGAERTYEFAGPAALA